MEPWTIEPIRRRWPFTFQITRYPNRRCANVEGENGILRCVIVNQLSQILWVDKLAAWPAGRKIVEALARLAIAREALVQMRPIRFDSELRQQGRNCCAHVADHAKV